MQLQLILLLVSVLSLGGLASGAYYYYTSTQEKLAILIEDNATLKLSAEIAEETRIKLEEDQKALNDDLLELTVKLAKSEEAKDSLQRLFQKHDLTKLTIAKPGLIQTRMNNGIKQVKKDFEEITKDE